MLQLELNQELSAWDNMGINIYITDLEHRVLYCNKSQLKTIALNREQVFGKKLRYLLGDEFADVIISHNNQVLTQRRALSFLEDYTLDGVLHHVMSYKQPFYQEGKLVGVLGYSIASNASHIVKSGPKPLTDSSAEVACSLGQLSSLSKELKPDKSNLFARQPEELIAFIDGLLNVLPGHFYCVDMSDRLIACNHNQAHSLGFADRADVVGLTLVELGMGEKFRQQVRRNNLEVCENTSTTPLVYYENEGEQYFISYKLALRDKDGAPEAVMGMSLDITDLTLAKQQVERISAAKTQFLMNLSHDIRTPCAGIAGLASLLLATTQDSLTQEYLTDIKGSVEQLTLLLNQVIENSRYDNGLVPVVTTEFNVMYLLKELLDLYMPEAKQKGLAFLVEGEDRQVTFYSDRNRVKQILVNLIGNAIKFTMQGSIHLRCHVVPNGELHVVVEDTGPGISKEHQQDVFRAFMQINVATRQANRGSGLGLSLVQQLAEEIGARVTVDSELGKGSKFTLVLSDNSA